MAGDPYDIVDITAADIPINATSTRNWWFVCLGFFILAPFVYVLYAYAEYRGYLDSCKRATPSFMTSWMPHWLFGGSGGGGGGGSSAGYSASYKAVGAASSTPISSAYGSA